MAGMWVKNLSIVCCVSRRKVPFSRSTSKRSHLSLPPDDVRHRSFSHYHWGAIVVSPGTGGVRNHCLLAPMSSTQNSSARS